MYGGLNPNRSSVMPNHEIQMKPAEVAQMLGISTRTLNRWHALRYGPPRCKIGRIVLYRKLAIFAWLEANEVQPTRTFAEGR